MTCKEFKATYRRGLILGTNAELAAARSHYRNCKTCRKWEVRLYKKHDRESLPDDIKRGCDAITSARMSALIQDPEAQ